MFDRLTAVAAPLPIANVDTDMVIPARFMKALSPHRTGAASVQELRYTPDGLEREDFVLNRGATRGAQILIADRNFGCGSSREHAVWALRDFGIRCVIAPSFGDIFSNNARKNGLLLIRLPAAICDRLRDEVALAQFAPMTVDLSSSASRWRRVKASILPSTPTIAARCWTDATTSRAPCGTRPRSPASKRRPRPDPSSVRIAGSAMQPAIALAAASAGLIRWVRPPRPCRFSKLRFDVAAQRSPGKRRSAFIPTHIEQPGSRQSKPAARRMRSIPSASACRLTSPDPGTTMARTWSATRRPSTTAATTRRSSMRLLVQLR